MNLPSGDNRGKIRVVVSADELCAPRFAAVGTLPQEPDPSRPGVVVVDEAATVQGHVVGVSALTDV